MNILNDNSGIAAMKTFIIVLKFGLKITSELDGKTRAVTGK